MQIQDRLFTLDAMRGIAAILVVLFHLSDFALNIVPGGYLAVDFFFALSGLVLAQAYSKPLTEGLSARDFMVKRIIRLYPLFMIGVGFAAIKAVGQLAVGDDNALPAGNVAISLALETAMLPSPFGGVDLFPLNGPAWSLFFELIINLALALSLVRMRISALCAVAAIAAGFIILAAATHGNTNVGWSWATSWGGLARVTFAFSAGVILHRMKSLPQFESVAFPVPIVLLVAIMLFPISSDNRIWFDCIVALLVAPALVALGFILQPPRPFRKLCGVLGDVSYPIYATHFPLIFIAGFIARKMGVEPVVWIPAFLTGLAVFAWLLGRFIDPPARSMLSSMLLKRKTVAYSQKA